MERRLFLSALGLTAGAAALPLRVLAQDKASVEQIAPLLYKNPVLTPLRGLQGQDLRCDRAWIEGKLPSDLRGDFYRNGPGLFERGGIRYQHWFDGDGMVHHWHFGEQGVSHRARFVETAKFVAESQANEFLVPSFGSAIKAKIPLRSPDTVNTANTNVILHQGRLLALWEGGSPYALSANTLDTESRVAFSEELEGMPFSAHPKVESDGTMWNFGSLMGKIILYHFGPDGQLKKHLVFDAPSSALVHDFVISQRHIIFLLVPIFIDVNFAKNGKSMAEGFIWKPQESVKVLVIEKADFTQRRVLELPAMMLFHFGNAWESGQTIYLDFVKSNDIEGLTTRMPKMMRGEDVSSTPSNPAFLKIDLSKNRVELSTRNDSVEFPRIDPRFVGQRHRYVFYPYAQGRTFNNLFNGVMRLDIDSGKTMQFDFGSDKIIEEHVFVPRRASRTEGDGWLVGVGFDVRKQQSFASIFDAQNLNAGPVALAHLPYWLPHCFHGNFYST